jgi:hypothetical protein
MSTRLRRLIFTILFVLGASSPFIGQAAAKIVLSLGQKEVARVASPDSLHEAVTIQTRPFLPYVHRAVKVYLVPSGETVDRLAEPVFLATRAEGLQTTWKDSRLLEICYLRARVEGFTAVWSSIVKSPKVEILLSPPAAGPSFSPGDD